MRLEGKRILITGASSGIGAALARAAAQKGARLVLAARRFEALEALAAGIAPAPLVVRCDVTDAAQVEALVEAARGALGGVDALVNNAAASVYGDAERTAVEDFERLMAVNFFGPLRATLALLPDMRRQGDGLIVNIASLAALHGVPYLGAYAASKAALAALSQSLRAELAGTGVRVLTVYPGYTRTPLFTREKKVGGARRPSRGYVPAETVARAIVRAIEQDRRELVLSLRGRLLNVLRGVLPAFVDQVMQHIAARLRVNKEVSNG